MEKNKRSIYVYANGEDIAEQAFAINYIPRKGEKIMERAMTDYIELEVVDVIHTNSVVYIKTKRVTGNTRFVKKMSRLIW